jgi:class 3 adenylate cyclase
MTLPIIDEKDQDYQDHLRLFLEEICCELIRFHHVATDGVKPESVRLNREVYLGTPGAYADIRIMVPGQKPYYMEVKYNYPTDKIVKHIKRKYSKDVPALREAQRLVLVCDTKSHPNWPAIEKDLRESLRPGLQLEVWDETRLSKMLRERFNVELGDLSPFQLARLRSGIDQAKWNYAYGTEHANNPLQASLLWHFGFWRLRQLRESGRLTPEIALPPEHYQDCVVLLADLCSFSSYVRDTRDQAIVRQCLMMFYSAARYEILNHGGMMYMFMGDEVIGLFGLPDRQQGYVQNALDCARALVDLGNSVSNLWQRQIDRMQSSFGVHIGMSIGDLEVVSLRPFSRSHMGAIGDCINLGARLRGAAGPGEIVISNSLYNKLDEDVQAPFEEQLPVEGKNVGHIKSWKWLASQAHQNNNGSSDSALH